MSIFIIIALLVIGLGAFDAAASRLGRGLPRHAPRRPSPMSKTMIGGHAMHPWTLYALELSRDRQREADLDRLAAEARAGMPSTPSRRASSGSPCSRGLEPRISGRHSSTRRMRRRRARPARWLPCGVTFARRHHARHRRDRRRLVGRRSDRPVLGRHRRRSCASCVPMPGPGTSLNHWAGRSPRHRPRPPGQPISSRSSPSSRTASCGTATGTASRGIPGNRSVANWPTSRRPPRPGARIGSTSGRPVEMA